MIESIWTHIVEALIFGFQFAAAALLFSVIVVLFLGFLVCLLQDKPKR